MARRNPNDRNEVAVQKAKAKAKAEDLDHFTLQDGTVVELKDIDAIFLQAVMGMVEYPERPKYDVTLASGRVVQYPMDEKVAEETPELKPIWSQYIFDQAKAAGDEMRLMTGTVILDGTKMPENWKDERWERRMRIIGAQLPEDIEERWVLYLRTKISQSDIISLTGKIMRRTGVPEEYIDAAEASFRDIVPGGQGKPGELDDAETDPGGVERQEAGQVVA